MSRPSKKAVMAALAGVFEAPDWTYEEWKTLGHSYGCVRTESGVNMYLNAPDVHKMRSKMLAFAQSIRAAQP